MTQVERLAPAGSDVKVMSWPMGVCADCAHPSHIERRRELRIPCALCERPIRNGESYRVLPRLKGAVIAQVHSHCEEQEKARV